MDAAHGVLGAAECTADDTMARERVKFKKKMDRERNEGQRPRRRQRQERRDECDLRISLRRAGRRSPSTPSESEAGSDSCSQTSELEWPLDTDPPQQAREMANAMGANCDVEVEKLVKRKSSRGRTGKDRMSSGMPGPTCRQQRKGKRNQNEKGVALGQV